ncbi:MAG TPA: tRNA guanosine(34) transglycosylase Tgt [Candidatus Paceibacterota bacterium]
MGGLAFKIEKKLGMARAGVLETAHGVIHTPALTAAATKATVKALDVESLREMGVESVLANTYHLYLQPGDELIKRIGGLHKFMNWSGPIFTDSGGFQAFSLGEAFGTGISKFIGYEDVEYNPSQHPKKARVDDDGVTFYSHIDGSEHRFTPESSIQIQHNLGADIILAFDECVSPHAPREAHEKAIERTRLWAERCLIEHKRLQANYPLPRSSEKIPRPSALGNPPTAPALFGIVQGGRYEDLRRKSARDIAALGSAPRSLGEVGFEGYAIGGSFVKEDMGTAVRWVCEELPEGKPRHLLGVGEPADLFAGVENGIDTFDCVAATRKARSGQLYTHSGEVSVKNAKYRELLEPVDPECQCSTCKNYTSAYLHHLFAAHELLAYELTSLHNLFFITNLLKQIRESILNGSFIELKRKFLSKFS